MVKFNQSEINRCGLTYLLLNIFVRHECMQLISFKPRGKSNQDFSF